MNEHKEVIETLDLIDEIETVGVEKLDQGDYDIIDEFIGQLKPYNNMVEMTINGLEVKIQDTYTEEDKDELDFFRAKGLMLDETILVLEDYLAQIQL